MRRNRIRQLGRIIDLGDRCRVSDGIFLLSLMYCSKLVFTVRISASDSCGGGASSAIFSTFARKKSVRGVKPVTRARALPSTRTRTVWSGSFNSCSTVASVPMVCRPSAVGSSSAAFFWVRSSICFSSFITSSSARTDFSRPTNNGTIMCGKTTMSRSGRTGAEFGSFVQPLVQLSWWRHPPLACSCRPPAGLCYAFPTKPLTKERAARICGPTPDKTKWGSVRRFQGGKD